MLSVYDAQVRVLCLCALSCCCRLCVIYLPRPQCAVLPDSCVLAVCGRPSARSVPGPCASRRSSCCSCSLPCSRCWRRWRSKRASARGPAAARTATGCALRCGPFAHYLPPGTPFFRSRFPTHPALPVCRRLATQALQPRSRRRVHSTLVVPSPPDSTGGPRSHGDRAAGRGQSVSVVCRPLPTFIGLHAFASVSPIRPKRLHSDLSGTRRNARGTGSRRSAFAPPACRCWLLFADRLRLEVLAASCVLAGAHVDSRKMARS